MFPLSFLKNEAKEVGLSLAQEQVFLMRFGDGRTYQSIADEIKTSTGACLKRMTEVYRKFEIESKDRRKEQLLRELLNAELQIKNTEYSSFVVQPNIERLAKTLGNVEGLIKSIKEKDYYKHNPALQNLIQFKIDSTFEFLNAIHETSSVNIPENHYPENVKNLQESLGDDFRIRALATLMPEHIGEYWPPDINKPIVDSTSFNSERIFILKRKSLRTHLVMFFSHAEKYSTYLLDYDKYLALDIPTSKQDFGVIDIDSNKSNDHKILVEHFMASKTYKFSVLSRESDKLKKYEESIETIINQSVKIDMKSIRENEKFDVLNYVDSLEHKVFDSDI